MRAQKLKVQVRTSRGKGAARKLRAQGFVPAVLYGKGTDPVALTVDPHEFLHRLDKERRGNTVFELEIEGWKGSGPVYAMVREHQEDTLRGHLLHLDFQRVHEQEPVEVIVPLEFTGRAKGVQMGGVAHQVFRELPIRCTPDKIPARIEFDVTELGLGAMVHVRDLPVEEGIQVLLSSDQTLYTITSGRVEVSEAEAEAAEEGEAEAKEGEGEGATGK